MTQRKRVSRAKAKTTKKKTTDKILGYLCQDANGTDMENFFVKTKEETHQWFLKTINELIKDKYKTWEANDSLSDYDGSSSDDNCLYIYEIFESGKVKEYSPVINVEEIKVDHKVFFTE